MNTNIRTIQKSDNFILAKIIREVFEEHDAPKYGTVYSDPTTDELYELFQKPKAVLWVAEYESKIVGCCGIYPTEGLPKHCAELVKFYLSSIARGKGIGLDLFLKSIQSAKEFGYTQLYLESLNHFSQALKMYERQGFVRINGPLSKSVHTTCDIWMLKNL